MSDKNVFISNNNSAPLLMNHSATNPIITDYASSSYFNFYELFAITLNVFYFLIGFPTNLLSIIVCCKSLMHNILNPVSSKHKRQFKRQYYERERSFISVLLNHNQNQSLIVRDNTDHELAKRTSHHSNNRNTNNNRHKTSSIKTANTQSNYKAAAAAAAIAAASSKNPHRKVFELYLVEISMCDLIILAYNFTEVLLMFLTKFNLVDQMYGELVLISQFSCRFVIGMNRTVILLHNWLIATMAATRCYAIYKPFNSNTSFSSKFYFRLNIFIVTFLLSLFISVNIYGVSLLNYYNYNNSSLSLHMNSSSNISAETSCQMPKQIYEKYPNIDVYINILLGIFGYSLPCLITLIINLVLIYNIRNVEMLKQSSSLSAATSKSNSLNHIPEILSSNGRNSSLLTNSNVHTGCGVNNSLLLNKNRAFFKTTSSLLTLSFSYIICFAPYSVLYLLWSLDYVKREPNLMYALTCLKSLNHTLNFYIYFITGKRFRNEVIHLLKIKKK
jgi:hypothetical protein